MVNSALVFAILLTAFPSHRGSVIEDDAFEASSADYYFLVEVSNDLKKPSANKNMLEVINDDAKVPTDVDGTNMVALQKSSKKPGTKLVVYREEDEEEGEEDSVSSKKPGTKLVTADRHESSHDADAQEKWRVSLSWGRRRAVQYRRRYTSYAPVKRCNTWDSMCGSNPSKLIRCDTTTKKYYPYTCCGRSRCAVAYGGRR